MGVCAVSAQLVGERRACASACARLREAAPVPPPSSPRLKSAPPTSPLARPAILFVRHTTQGPKARRNNHPPLNHPLSSIEPSHPHSCGARARASHREKRMDSLPAAPPALRQWLQRTEVQLGMCVVGVVGSLLIYGVLQVRACGTRTKKREPSLVVGAAPPPNHHLQGWRPCARARGSFSSRSFAYEGRDGAAQQPAADWAIPLDATETEREPERAPSPPSPSPSPPSRSPPPPLAPALLPSNPPTPPNPQTGTRHDPPLWRRSR